MVERRVAVAFRGPDGGRTERYSGPEAGPLGKVTIGTGLRLGEVCWLRWQDVDTDAGYLTMRQQAQQMARRSATSLPRLRRGRQGASTRGVPQVLRPVKACQAAEGLAFGRDWTDTDLVFTHQTDRSDASQRVQGFRSAGQGYGVQHRNHGRPTVTS